MRKPLPCFGLLLIAFIFPGGLTTIAQVPQLQWQKSLGGTKDDHAYSLVQSPDGNFVIAGGAISDDGDVTGHHPSTPTPLEDFWIVKIDSGGSNILWEKSYGGSNGDVARAIANTNDHGFIIAGNSTSSDGDVTGHHGGSSYDDYWIVKIDSSGALQWEHSYGGTKNDLANAIIQTSDGGYLVTGESGSKDGDVTGHHGAINDADIWILKLDASGNILWEDSYGGTARDVGNSIVQTADGDYIIGGYAFSTDGDVTGHHGLSTNSDIWILKIDDSGQIIWEKSFGGSSFEYGGIVSAASSGGFIFAGASTSSDGDLTSNYGSFDYWVVKTDSIGTIEWQKSYGGTNDDEPFSIINTNCGGYVVHGESVSNDIDVSGNHGNDYWTMAINGNGNLLWQKCLGGSSGELGTQIIKTSHGYVVTGVSDSNDGDVTGHHGNTGYLNGDYWVVGLEDTTAALTASVSTLQNISCYGENNASALASATGGIAPYAYSWNTNPTQFSDTISNLSAGDYSVTVTDSAGCNSSQIITISQPSQLYASAGGDTLICAALTIPLGGNPTAFGGVSGYSYTWFPESYNIGDTSNPVVEVDTTTLFTVLVTDSNGCIASDSVLVTVTICTQNEVVETAHSSLMISPNPFIENTSIIYSIANPFHQAELHIQDISGKLLSIQTINHSANGKIELNGGFLKDGVYIIQLYSDGQMLATKKMVVSH